TSINPPTPAVEAWAGLIGDREDVKLVIVADTKTPVKAWEGFPCIFLSLDEQHELFPTLEAAMPKAHYCRKNLGYAYARSHGMHVFETDDDNAPSPKNDFVLNEEIDSFGLFDYLITLASA